MEINPLACTHRLDDGYEYRSAGPSKANQMILNMRVGTDFHEGEVVKAYCEVGKKVVKKKAPTPRMKSKLSSFSEMDDLSSFNMMNSDISIDSIPVRPFGKVNIDKMKKPPATAIP